MHQSIQQVSALETLVANRLRKFCRPRSIRVDQRDELKSAGLYAVKSTLLQKPEASEAYLCTVADNAFSAALKSDRCIVVPDTTRRRRIKRGDEPGDLTRHTLKNRYEAPPDEAAAQAAIRESLEVILFLCGDDLDRQIVLARWDGGKSIDNRPIHTSQVAKQVGCCQKTVIRRLDALEQRYYEHIGNRRPTRRRLK